MFIRESVSGRRLYFFRLNHLFDFLLENTHAVLRQCHPDFTGVFWILGTIAAPVDDLSGRPFTVSAISTQPNAARFILETSKRALHEISIFRMTSLLGG